MVIYYESAARDLGLMHHGIKGQKWGIRRFQNKDGSLTKEGRKRYLTSDGKLTKEGQDELKRAYARAYDDADENQKMIDEELAEKGLTKVNDRDSVMKKGSVVGRIAGDEGVDNRRKYVYITDDDYDNYDNVAYDLPIKGDAYRYEYELTKDARIANFDQVMDYVVQNYGNKTLKEIGLTPRNMSQDEYASSKAVKKLIKEFGNMPVSEMAKYRRENTVLMNDQYILKDGAVEPVAPQWIKDRANASQDALRLHLNKTLLNSKVSDKIFDHYKSKGYDAIVDIEDKMAEYDMPVIFLDPRKTFKLRSKEAMWQEGDGMNYYISTDQGAYLVHHGIKGMKWGIRRFQNPDGSLTAAGRRRYGTAEGLRAAYDEKIRRKTSRMNRRAEAARVRASSTEDAEKKKRLEEKSKDLKEGAKSVTDEYKAWMADRDASQKAKQKVQEERAKAAEERAKADAEKAAAKQKEIDDKAAKEEADRKAEVDKAVASGDPAKIEKVMDKMTTQEIKDAIGRVQTMEDLRAKIPKSALGRGVDFMKDLAVDKIKTEITKKVMNLGNDPEDALSKDEKDYRSRMKSILAEMSDAGGKAQTKKDYSGALNKEVQEQEAKNVAKMIKDLEKAGIPHDQATKMGQQIMAKRMKDYEDSGSDVYSNQRAANENQNGGTSGDKKPSGGDSGGSKTGKDKPGKQEQSAPEQSTYDKALKEMKDAAAAVDKTPTPKTSFSRAWLSSTPSIKSADLTTSVKNIKVSSSANDLIQRYKSASFSSAKTAAEKINPFGSKTDSVKDTRPFTGNDNWKDYYKKTDSEKAWNDRYHPDQIKFNWHDDDNASRSSGSSSTSSSKSSTSTLDAIKKLASSGSKAVNSNNLSKLDSYTLSLLRRKRR